MSDSRLVHSRSRVYTCVHTAKSLHNATFVDAGFRCTLADLPRYIKAVYDSHGTRLVRNEWTSGQRGITLHNALVSDPIASLFPFLWCCLGR